jgi:hypothetical protein
MDSDTHLELAVLPQPDDLSCGPTCLHAVYQYYGDAISLDEVIGEVTPLPGGGTLAVSLACHALKRGYAAKIYTYNLQTFDPTWFRGRQTIAEKLKEQKRIKRREKLAVATDIYLEFLELGGTLRYKDLSRALIRGILNRGRPILTGLSATYLYGCAREYGGEYDDIRGDPTGHFVVVSGYHPASREVTVADPLGDNPLHGKHYYRVGIDRLMAAMLLGIVTYDANLLVIERHEPH